MKCYCGSMAISSEIIEISTAGAVDMAYFNDGIFVSTPQEMSACNEYWEFSIKVISIDWIRYFPLAGREKSRTCWRIGYHQGLSIIIKRNIHYSKINCLHTNIIQHWFSVVRFGEKDALAWIYLIFLKPYRRSQKACLKFFISVPPSSFPSKLSSSDVFNLQNWAIQYSLIWRPVLLLPWHMKYRETRNENQLEWVRL